LSEQELKELPPPEEHLELLEQLRKKQKSQLFERQLQHQRWKQEWWIQKREHLSEQELKELPPPEEHLELLEQLLEQLRQQQKSLWEQLLEQLRGLEQLPLERQLLQHWQLQHWQQLRLHQQQLVWHPDQLWRHPGQLWLHRLLEHEHQIKEHRLLLEEHRLLLEEHRLLLEEHTTASFCNSDDFSF
jgi:hypothetical protein